jgi:hypothetical protein
MAQCDWLLSSVSIATLYLTGQLIDFYNTLMYGRCRFQFMSYRYLREIHQVKGASVNIFIIYSIQLQ